MNEHEQKQPQNDNNLLETGLGAAGGGVAGAAIGKTLGGNKDAVVGAIAGAVAGGIVGEVVADDLKAEEKRVAETLGFAHGEDEISAHYSWEDLQALSKPQNSYKSEYRSFSIESGTLSK